MQKDFTDRVNENQGTVIQFLSEDNSHCRQQQSTGDASCAEMPVDFCSFLMSCPCCTNIISYYLNINLLLVYKDETMCVVY